MLIFLNHSRKQIYQHYLGTHSDYTVPLPYTRCPVSSRSVDEISLNVEWSPSVISAALRAGSGWVANHSTGSRKSRVVPQLPMQMIAVTFFTIARNDRRELSCATRLVARWLVILSRFRCKRYTAEQDLSLFICM